MGGGRVSTSAQTGSVLDIAMYICTEVDYGTGDVVIPIHAPSETIDDRDGLSSKECDGTGNETT